MKIALVHTDTPSRKGIGATHRTTWIGRLLEDLGYDMMAYYLSEPGDEPRDGGGRVRIAPDGLPFPTATALNARLAERAGGPVEMDFVHTYLPRSLPRWIASAGRSRPRPS